MTKEGVDIELGEEYKITSNSREYKLIYTGVKQNKTIAHCSTLEHALECYIRRKGRLSGAKSIKELKSALCKAMAVVQDVRDQLEIR